MNPKTDLRVDTKTSAAISEAMNLLTEFGYDRAKAYLDAEGVGNMLSQNLLSLRFDRRRPTHARETTGVGIFRGSSSTV